MPLLLAMDSWRKPWGTYFSQTLLFFIEWSWQYYILKDCQDELCYTDMSVLDYVRRASVQSRSSKKMLLVFPKEFSVSDFTFHITHSAYWNIKTNKNKQERKKAPNHGHQKTPQPNKKPQTTTNQKLQPNKKTQTKQNQAPRKPLSRRTEISIPYSCNFCGKN